MRGRYANQSPFAAEKRPYPTTQVPQPNAAALHGRAGQITESVQVETTVKSPEASDQPTGIPVRQGINRTPTRAVRMQTFSVHARNPDARFTIATNRSTDQEVSALALHLVQASLVYVKPGSPLRFRAARFQLCSCGRREIPGNRRQKTFKKVMPCAADQPLHDLVRRDVDRSCQAPRISVRDLILDRAR